jgi:peptide deformylase
MLSIITVPNPTLRQISKRVQSLDKKTTQFIIDLGEKLVKKSDPPGVGLSAVQVGNLERLLITYLKPNDPNPHPPKDAKGAILTAYINPVITAHSETVTLGPDPKHPILEGCLSIPNVYGPVWRWDWIDVEFITNSPDGDPKGLLGGVCQVRLEGFSARVFQHEFDHLDGILFTDHILKEKQPLYFDNDHDLIPVANPAALIQW